MAQVIQRISQPDGGGGFTLTGRGWIDGRDQNQFGTFRFNSQLIDRGLTEFGHMGAIGYQRLGR